MITYFVSRHNGALEWAHRKGLEAQRVTHLDPNDIRPGDIVIGTLPVHLIAEVNERGARYLHLEMALPLESRGQDLSADDMERLGARLQEYRAEKV